MVMADIQINIDKINELININVLKEKLNVLEANLLMLLNTTNK